MIRYLVASWLSLYAMAISADTFKSEEDSRNLTERVMSKAGAGDFSGAFATLKPYALMPE